MLDDPTPSAAVTIRLPDAHRPVKEGVASGKIGSIWKASALAPKARKLLGKGMRPMTNDYESDEGLSVTQLLHDWKNGDEAALDSLTPIVYDELLRIARRQLRGERQDHTLAPTALVHEVWMRMLNQNRADWRDRTHFFALASRFMRRILVDYSRNHNAQKRGGAAVKISMDEGFDVGQPKDASINALDDALTALAEFDDRKAKVIELRYFGGLTVNEIAEHLGVSVATVGRELRMAQAWLHREMCANQ